MTQRISPRPLNLGEIFEYAVRALRRTVAPGLLIALIFLLVPGLILIAAVDSFYTSLGEAMTALATHDPSGDSPLGEMGGAALGTLAAAILFGVAALIARLAMTTLTCAEILGVPMTWGRAVQRAVGVRFGRAAGQVALESAALGGILFAGYAAFILFAILRFFALLAPLVFLSACALCLWLSIRWSMTIPAIVSEEVGALGSFGRSSELVEGEWWRVFGILLLFALLRDLVLAFLAMPVLLLSLGDAFSFLTSLSPPHRQLNPGMIGSVISSMGLGAGVSIVLWATGAILVIPAYQASLYFDLRGRFGDEPFPRGADAPEPLHVEPGPVKSDMFGKDSPWGDPDSPKDTNPV